MVKEMTPLQALREAIPEAVQAIRLAAKVSVELAWY